MFAPRLVEAQTKAGARSTGQLAAQRSTFASRDRPARDAAPSVSWGFSKIPMFPPDRANRTRAGSPLITPLLPGIAPPKLRVGAVDDPLERAADGVAEQVMRMPDPEFRKPAYDEEAQPLQTNKADASYAASRDTAAGGGNALEPEDRRFFESRFHHNFADVRVHADTWANQSAMAVDARAFTLANDVSFAPGEYRQGTREGRHLLAHELAHVIQQRSLYPDGSLIQRQPKQDQPKPDLSQAPKPRPEKKQTLKESGIDANDPVFEGTSQIIDQVLQRNQRLKPYIGARLEKKTNTIAEKGKFIHELNNANFDSAYRDHLGSDPPSDILGFFDAEKSIIHLRPSATFGTALHEAVHKLASPQLFNPYGQVAQRVSEDLLHVLIEGLTAYFTDCILNDEKLPNFIDAYADERKKARKLVSELGFDVMAKFNFNGDLQGLIGKLGLSMQQYGQLKGEGMTELFKRMNKLL